MEVGKTIWNQRITMRDGIEIAVDVVLPRGRGPFPAVVSRTPYVRGAKLKNPSGWMRLVSKGYAFIVADVRGRNDSEGEFIPWSNDSDDAYDVIEWVAEQTWCLGRVGTVGGSYDGRTQWAALKAKPPHLVCAAPLCVGSVGSELATFGTGVPCQYRIWWLSYVNGKTSQYAGSPSWESAIAHAPLKSLDQKFGVTGSNWQRYISGEIDPSLINENFSPQDFAEIDIPVLIGVGWWDDITTMDNWIGLQKAKSAKDCRLLIGAWDHAGNTGPRRTLGGMDVSKSVIDTIGYIEKFLAIHLKGEKNELSTQPRCNIFDVGKDQWLPMDQWPCPQAEATAIYLNSDGDARGLQGNGRLSSTVVTALSSDTYTYDPNKPARDVGSLDRFAWSDPPLDHRYLHRRNDILLYDSETLQKPLLLSGRVFLRAFVSSDRPDTDLYVGINDVHPDGRAIGLFATNEPKGGLRLRYRNGANEELMMPHKIYEVEVPGIWLHHTFKVGHRLRITINSNDFPFSARNAGTGKHWAEDIELIPQANTIYYGSNHSSHVVLPIVTGEFN